MIFRARFITNVVALAGLLLVFLTPALAVLHPYKNHVARQTASPCIPESLIGRVGAGNGGRKIGVVIDASGSMATNDPHDIRLKAAKALDDVLISTTEATGGKTADLVSIVDFA